MNLLIFLMVLIMIFIWWFEYKIESQLSITIKSSFKVKWLVILCSVKHNLSFDKNCDLNLNWFGVCWYEII